MIAFARRTARSEPIVAAVAPRWHVPSALPLLSIGPALLRHARHFRWMVPAGCGVTILLYLATIPIAARFGVTL